jgi:hypothetical protein
MLIKNKLYMGGSKMVPDFATTKTADDSRSVWDILTSIMQIYEHMDTQLSELNRTVKGIVAQKCPQCDINLSNGHCAHCEQRGQ